MKTDKEIWPFEDPVNAAVFSIKQIVFGGEPILHVTHDSDDGAWQFLGANTPSSNDLAIVSLEEIVVLDPGVKELSDLPLGWEAWRNHKNDNWRRSPKAL